MAQEVVIGDQHRMRNPSLLQFLLMANHTALQSHPPHLLHTLQGNAQCPTAHDASHRMGGRGHLTIQPVQWGLLRLQWPLVQVPPNVREAPKLVTCCRVQASICAGQLPQHGPAAWGQPHRPPASPCLRQTSEGGPSPDLLRPLHVEPTQLAPPRGVLGMGPWSVASRMSPPALGKCCLPTMRPV